MSSAVLLSMNTGLFLCAAVVSTIGGGIYGSYQAIKGVAHETSLSKKIIAGLVGFGIGSAEGLGFGVFGAVIGISMNLGAELLAVMGMVGPALMVASLSSAIGMAVPTIGTYIAEKLTPFSWIGKALEKFGGKDEEHIIDESEVVVELPVKKDVSAEVIGERTLSVREQRLKHKAEKRLSLESGLEDEFQPGSKTKEQDNLLSVEGLFK